MVLLLQDSTKDLLNKNVSLEMSKHLFINKTIALVLPS
jgi:hypothetical protein